MSEVIFDFVNSPIQDMANGLSRSNSGHIKSMPGTSRLTHIAKSMTVIQTFEGRFPHAEKKA